MRSAGAVVKRLGVVLGASLLALPLSFFGAWPEAAAQSSANSSPSSLQGQIDAQNAQIAQLTAEIAQYEAQIASAKANKQTLQNALNQLSAQLSRVKAQAQVTQRQITITNLKIEQLSGNIASAQSSIDADSAALAENLRSLAEADDTPMLVRLISSDSLAAAWQDSDQIIEIQNGIQDQIASLAAQKAQLGAAKNASQQEQENLTAQRAQLISQQQAISQTANSKTQLLIQTNAQEATYEKLLKEAQDELASFSAFAQNAGGAGLLTNQTSCDSWGCYYNQRDSAWGNLPINGTKYPMKSDGCLITSMAMVMTHYGYTDVTPVTIESNPANFAAYFPAYLLYTISVDGMTVARKTAKIDATLASGEPVIVGLYAYGGTHYVVLTSGSGGNYLMRDPYQPNAKDVPFTKYYRVANIFGVNKVVIN